MEKYFVRCTEIAIRETDSFGNHYPKGFVNKSYMGYDEEFKPVMESGYGFMSAHRAAAFATMEKRKLEREERDIMNFDKNWKPVWDRKFDVVSFNGNKVISIR